MLPRPTIFAAAIAVVLTAPLAAWAQPAPAAKPGAAPKAAPPSAAAAAAAAAAQGDATPPAGAAAPSSEGKTTPTAEEEEGPFAPKTKKRLGHAGAEGEPEAAPVQREPEPHGRAGVDTVIGFGKQGGTPSTRDEVSAYSWVFGGGYRFGDHYALGLAFPLSTASITTTKPSGTKDKYDQSAIGNVALTNEYRFDAGESAKIPVGILLAFPTASGDPFANPSTDPQKLREAGVNALASASRGLETDALFLPKRFGVVPSGGIDLKSGHVEAGGSLAFPLLFKSGGTEPDPNITAYKGAKANSLATEIVTTGRFHYALLDDKIAVGLRAILVNFLSNPATYENIKPPAAQFSLEPGALVRISFLRAGASVILPVAGRINEGSQSMTGIRILLGAAF